MKKKVSKRLTKAINRQIKLFLKQFSSYLEEDKLYTLSELYYSINKVYCDPFDLFYALRIKYVIKKDVGELNCVYFLNASMNTVYSYEYEDK